MRKLFLRKLKRIAKKTKWQGNEITITALWGMTILWFVIAGIYGAILNIPMKPHFLVLFQKILPVTVIFLVTLVVARIAVGFVNLYASKIKGVLPSWISSSFSPSGYTF